MQGSTRRGFFIGVFLTGLVFGLPAYAAKHMGPGGPGGGPGMQQMSGMMHDMSSIMTNMWAQMEGAN